MTDLHAVRRVWGHRTLGPLVRSAVGFLALWVALQVGFRSNRPPLGIYVYGVTIGLLYSFLALGLILVYRANRIINFAQAEIGAVSAVLAVLLIKVHHWPYVLALGVALVSGVISGAVVEFAIVRRFFKASRLVLSVATIGVALVFASLQLFLPLLVGGELNLDPTPPNTPFSSVHMNIGSYLFDANTLVVFVFAAFVVVALTLFFRRTDIGIAVRGSAENADRAALLGIPVKRVSTVVWMIAALLSTLSVFLRVPIIGMPVGVHVGPAVLLFGLTAAVMGRMENMGTAFVAGIALGIVEQSVYYFTRDALIAPAVILPILLGAMFLQRTASRARDSGVATWSLAKEYRPIPPELRSVPEVRWGRPALGVLVALILLGGFELLGLKQQVLSSVVVTYAIVVVSMVVLTGWGGQISLGQWGISGLGALAIGYLSAHRNADFFMTLVVAGLIGAIAAVVLGLPALRVSGLYLAVTTMAFAIVVPVYFLSTNYLGDLLPSATVRITRPSLYGRVSLEGDRAFYYVTLIALALCLLSARALRRSRTGRAIIAQRDNVRGAESYGIGSARIKLWAFAISGFWAAIGGALFAYHQGAIDATSFSPELSLTFVIILVIGGVTSLPGALLGTAYFGILQYADISTRLTLLATGAGALLLLYAAPGGLAQLFYGSRDALLRAIAERRGIVVPSLLADVRTQDVAGADAEVIAAAVEAVDVPGEHAMAKPKRAKAKPMPARATSVREEVGAR